MAQVLHSVAVPQTALYTPRLLAAVQLGKFSAACLPLTDASHQRDGHLAVRSLRQQDPCSQFFCPSSLYAQMPAGSSSGGREASEKLGTSASAVTWPRISPLTPCCSVVTTTYVSPGPAYLRMRHDKYQASCNMSSPWRYLHDMSPEIPVWQHRYCHALPDRILHAGLATHATDTFVGTCSRHALPQITCCLSGVQAHLPKRSPDVRCWLYGSSLRHHSHTVTHPAAVQADPDSSTLFRRGIRLSVRVKRM